ncbi:MAG: MBL fold metallo-hydrolase [Clostridia bacterium]|nr:MBL fold metallo-hydrolase [Clostridia bacterium]
MNGRVKFKRRLKAIACVLLAACLLFCSACGGSHNSGNGGGEEVADTDSDEKTEVVFDTDGCFSVHFLDVGEGDAIFIDFADGKTMLIDCGEKKESNLKTIENCLDEYVTDDTLNYLVLTHPDSDHVGNAADILTDYTVERAYIPHLLQPEKFNPYYDAYTIINNARIAGEMTRVYSEVGKMVYGDDYYLIMLSPNAKGTTDSAYDKVNSSADPSADDINNISPIIYLDYKGVRFIFTGDAGFSQEKVTLNNVELGFVNRYLTDEQKAKFNLTDIDFLKVSHHGSDDASGNEFLQRITPKNAVISVGGDNNYGHPKTATLNRILAANENCTLYLTCEKGTVSVYVNEDGQTMIKTAAAMAA